MRDRLRKPTAKAGPRRLAGSRNGRLARRGRGHRAAANGGGRCRASSGLSAAVLAIVRELWRWREAEAERRDSPVRRVLRDDLIVELAKRQTADLKQIRAVRGMERGDLQRLMPQIARHIEAALQLPDSELPQTERRDVPPQINVLGQFIASALTSICRSSTARPQHGRHGQRRARPDRVSARLRHATSRRYWPAAGGPEVVGQQLDDLLFGRTSIRIVNPKSDEPLAFEPTVSRDATAEREG